MDYNLLNGGLVLKIGEKLIANNMKNYTTVFKDNTYDMFWFMNHDETNIYYSNQKQGNSLWKIDIESKKEQLIIDIPCYGVFLYKNSLYYINENDRCIYKCSTDGKSISNIVDEPVGTFIIEREYIFYTTTQGIRICSELGVGKRLISHSVASLLMLIGKILVFTDKNKQHAVTILDLETNNAVAVDNMASSSINTDGKYCYLVNRLNNNSISRIDIETGNSIRICSECAEYLHLIENELYFCINKEWHKMTITGGQPEKLDSI